MNPKISVIVPVYKAEKYLNRCVDSILAQTFTDFEVLLIDDGSPDRSGEICDEYAKKDSRVRVFHKENGGPSLARNLGIDHAQGKYLLFVDSDDIIGPMHLEDLVASSDSESHMLVIQGLTAFTSKGNHIITLTNNVYTSKDISNFLEENGIGNMGYSVCKLYDIDIINKYNIRMNPEVFFGEDIIFFMHYLCHINKVVVIDKVDYYYDNTESTLSKCKPKSFINEMKTFTLIMKYIKDLSLIHGFNLSAIPLTLKFHISYLKRALSYYVVVDKLNLYNFLKDCESINEIAYDYANAICKYLNNLDRCFCQLFGKKKNISLFVTFNLWYMTMSLYHKLRSLI